MASLGSSAAACDAPLLRRYTPSAWELSWKSRISRQPDGSKQWLTHCSSLKNETNLMDHWLALGTGRTATTAHRHLTAADAADEQWNASILSHHTYVDGCSNVVLRRVPIEPLVSFLRHPRHTCFNVLSYKYARSYLFPMHGNREHVPSPPARCLFFDLGASLYSFGTGGASLQWFVELYDSRGCRFQSRQSVDRILAWEARPWNASFLFGSMPPRVQDVMSYYNVPVDATPGARHNPWRAVAALARPEDFVIVKLDIDHSVTEEALVEQLLKNERGVTALIDDFYYEHHVSDSPMLHQGWAQCRSCGAPTQTLAQSYDVFTRLRELGIRAHSWV